MGRPLVGLASLHDMIAVQSLHASKTASSGGVVADGEGNATPAGSLLPEPGGRGVYIRLTSTGQVPPPQSPHQPRQLVFPIDIRAQGAGNAKLMYK